MKFLVVIAALLGVTEFAQGSQSYTTVQCADTSGQFSGSDHLKTPAHGFSAVELKDIVLGARQVLSAPMPYPADVVVAPNPVDLQELKIAPSTSLFRFSKAFYFKIEAENFTQLNVFCTMTEQVGL